MALARLLDLTTLEICEFPINQMPPYLAVSHVWSEGLFAPSHRDHLESCVGLQMVQSCLKQVLYLSRLQYCWVDTFSINQDDPEDKARQIPLMGDIYKHAHVVAVAVNQSFSFSYEDWDLAMSNLRDAFQFIRSATSYNSPEARTCYSSSIVSENLAWAGSMLDELTKIPWFHRVWTAQEYILAKDITWIGLDHKVIRLSHDDVRFVNKLGAYRRDIFGLHGKVGDLISMTRIRLGRAHPTQAMRLALHRECLAPEDEIYGLMAASEVVVPPLYDIGLNAAWQRWWEKAIVNGHIMWAMMRTSNSKRSDPGRQGGNCIMPSAYFRHDAINFSGVEVGVRPYATLELDEGSVSFVGRIAGTCTIEMCVGDLAEGMSAKVIQDVVSTVSGNVEVMTRFCTALSLGLLDAAEVSTWAKSACDDYRARTNGLPISRDQRQMATSYESWMNRHRNNLRYGKTYLGTIDNQFGTTDILVNADEAPKGRLLALDVGTNMLKDDQDDAQNHGYAEDQVFMIIRVPAGKDGVRETLHKVGTTSNIFVPASKKVSRATAWGGTVLEENFDRYRIGGASCSYCHPQHRSSTPDPPTPPSRSWTSWSKPWTKPNKKAGSTRR